MTIENNTNNTTTTTATEKDYSAVSELWGTKLADVEAYQIAKANFDAWLSERENEPFGKFFEAKSSKNQSVVYSSLYLAMLLHTTTGNIDAKYDKTKRKAMEKALREGTPYDEQATAEGFICDILAPNLAELRAQKEAELVAKRAERLALRDSVNHAIEAVKDTWNDAGLTPNAELVKKACTRKLERDEPTFAKAFCVELAYSVLDGVTCTQVCNELGVDVGNDGLPKINDNGDLVTEEPEVSEPETTDEPEHVEVNVD